MFIARFLLLLFFFFVFLFVFFFFFFFAFCVCGIYLFQRVGVGREVNSSPVNQSKTTERERFAQRTDRKLGQGTEVPCPLNTSCRATTGPCTHWPRHYPN